MVKIHNEVNVYIKILSVMVDVLFPLRKESRHINKVSVYKSYTLIQMSSQQVVIRKSNNSPIYGVLK